MEKELKEMKEKVQEQPTPMTQSPKVPNAFEVPSVDSLSQAMSQVSLKTIEITGMMKQNRDLMEMVDVREDLKKKVEERCR